MFHQGDVQSGIAAAVQNGKSVVCFVTDDSQECQTWEHNWLTDQNLPQKLESKAVTLRIEKDSAEAQQLSAFYPVAEAPTLLVINQGKLDAQLHSGVSKNDFTLSLLKALHPNLGKSSSSSSSVPTASATPTAPSSASTARDVRPNESSPQARAPNTSSTTAAPTSSRVSDPQQESYAQRQARHKREANQERERVRALIEADKRARKAQQEERRRQAQAEANSEVDAASERRAEQLKARITRAGCSLQVRLLDGSTLRRKFQSEDSLHAAVRPWVDQNRTDDTMPYTLKLILTPQPSRSLSDADEARTLAELGLVPSATLVLVPVKNFSEAYRASGSRGFIAGAPALLYGYIMSLFAAIPAFVMRLVGRQDTTSAPQSALPSRTETNEDQSEAPSSKIRIKTLHDQQDGAKDDQQLYNGNTLNFEPKPKDDEDG